MNECTYCNDATDNPARICVGCRTEVVTDPSWLIANGTPDRFEVLRSPLVSDDDEMYEPVLRYIAGHGLALSARETFEDGDWMFGRVEVSVYVPASMLAASYAEAMASA